MKKTYYLIFGLLFTGALNAQVIFQTNLSSWSNGKPTDFWGSATNLAASNITEVPAVMYGTSAAAVKNTGLGHKRLTTQTLNVDTGATYEIKMYVKAMQGMLRTNYYNVTNVAYGSYNSYFDLSVESAGQLVELSQIVTVSSTTDSAQFILSFHSTDSLDKLVIDSVVISKTTPPVVTPYTINQIQYTTTPPYDSPHNGELVQTTGIVTAAHFNGYFIQDGVGAFNGIFVYDNVNTPVIGDNVTVTGLVEEFFGYTEIKNVTVFTTNSTGNTLPAVTNISTQAVFNEDYEGVLVKVSNATCTVDTTTNGFGEWTINDGTGEVRVDNKMYNYNGIVSTAYNVTAVVDYSATVIKILQPRYLADIEIATSVEEINESKLVAYPNPVQNQFTIETAVSNFTVDLYDITGKNINQYSAKDGKLTINTTNLNNGVYFYSILNAENQVVESNKFIISK
ncbi:MAG: T9SS type A sorting domain-containing protein [Flavobacteriales bacterium]|nr:T9SS type A sorting domain-containing protein [Flavobacteriales bacterium]